MTLFAQHETNEKNPDVTGWYCTDKGDLFWNGKIWSSRDDIESDESPNLWYEVQQEKSDALNKAAKWDALDEKIGEFYGDADELEETQQEEEGLGLIGIGEIAAEAFGYF